MLVLDSRVPLEQPAELEGAEVDGPDPITDLLKAHVFADADRGNVHPAADPANATVGADVADFEAIGILERREQAGAGGGTAGGRAPRRAIGRGPAPSVPAPSMACRPKPMGQTTAEGGPTYAPIMLSARPRRWGQRTCPSGVRGLLDRAGRGAHLACRLKASRPSRMPRGHRHSGSARGRTPCTVGGQPDLYLRRSWSRSARARGTAPSSSSRRMERSGHCSYRTGRPS